MEPTSGATGATTPPPEDQPVVRPKVRASAAEVSSETETTTEETRRKKKKAKKKKAKPVPTTADVAGALAPDFGIETASNQKPRKVSTRTTTMLETLKTTGVVIPIEKLMAGLQSLDLSKNILEKQEAQTSSTPFITEAKKHFFASEPNEMSALFITLSNIDRFTKACNAGQSEKPNIKALKKTIFKYFTELKFNSLLSLLQHYKQINPNNATETSLTSDLMEVLKVLETAEETKNIGAIVTSTQNSRERSSTIQSLMLCYEKLRATHNCINCYINATLPENQASREEIIKHKPRILQLTQSLSEIDILIKDNMDLFVRGTSSDFAKLHINTKTSIARQHSQYLAKICQLLQSETSIETLKILKVTNIANSILRECTLEGLRYNGFINIFAMGRENEITQCKCAIIHQTTLVKILLNILTKLLKE